MRSLSRCSYPSGNVPPPKTPGAVLAVGGRIGCIAGLFWLELTASSGCVKVRVRVEQRKRKRGKRRKRKEETEKKKKKKKTTTACVSSGGREGACAWTDGGSRTKPEGCGGGGGGGGGGSGQGVERRELMGHLLIAARALSVRDSA
eukprot:1682981-Rhodomonas_salina.1